MGWAHIPKNRIIYNTMYVLVETRDGIMIYLTFILKHEDTINVSCSRFYISHVKNLQPTMPDIPGYMAKSKINFRGITNYAYLCNILIPQQSATSPKSMYALLRILYYMNRAGHLTKYHFSAS